MSVPLSNKLEWELANPLWAQALNPIIASPLSSSRIITASLINGATIINHGLGRLMQGWFIVDINGAATIYRSQPLNTTTLTLTSNAAVIAKIGVF
jgi:hypothetical protein